VTAGAIICFWISPGDALVVTAGELFVAGDCVLVAGGGVVVNEGTGLGGGSPHAGAAATHNVANTTAFAITSAITAALRERTRDRAPLMPSPLAVTILAILVRSEQSDASSWVLRFVTFFVVSSVITRLVALAWAPCAWLPPKGLKVQTLGNYIDVSIKDVS
jgi:hypothetical protein